MEKNYRLQIYKAIIQYLLESTPYTLNSIADLAGTSLEIICSIYCNDLIPPNFLTESKLVNLYQTILELNKYKNHIPDKYIIEIRHVPS